MVMCPYCSHLYFDIIDGKYVCDGCGSIIGSVKDEDDD